METMQNQQSNSTHSEVSTFFFSTFGRMLIIFGIGIVLLLPLHHVHKLIYERKQRSEQVIKKIDEEWGQNVVYKGIVLRVPLLKTKKNQTQEFATFYPKSESDAIQTNISEKKRGIYKRPIFQAEINSTAHFSITHKDPLLDWENAQIGIVLSNDTRFQSIDSFLINKEKVAVSTQTSINRFSFLNFVATHSIGAKINQPTFSATIRFVVKGSSEIELEPLASTANYTMKSNWHSPSFEGKITPDPQTLKITKNGFTARWKKVDITSDNSNYHMEDINSLNQTNSVISFFQPIDQYQLNERTVKYGILVIVLTFAVFFLIELIGKMAVHPIHYAMIGLSLVLFYALLLSFSEQIGFIKSYIIASCAIVFLLFWYAKSVLQSLKFAITIGLSLSLLYLFLLVIVNLETYALIVGSIGLFLVLVAIMSITRRLKIS